MHRVPRPVKRTAFASPSGAPVLAVDDLRLEIRRSTRRQTLGLTVDRGGELVLSAPECLDDRTLRAFVREKKVWIYTKLAAKGALQSTPARKEFVTGEGFHYLGRSYRLLLIDTQDRPLKLDAGRFRFVRDEAERGRKHFVRWYSDHAASWLSRRAGEWAPSLGVEPVGVKILDLGHRWGSCGKGKTINFHWASILLPPSIVDYIVVHELVHLREPNHTPEFWSRVERALPDYERRKAWLAENGAGHAAF